MKRLNLLFQIITVMGFDVLASSSGYSFLYMKILKIIIILLSENNSLKYIDTISS